MSEKEIKAAIDGAEAPSKAAKGARAADANALAERVLECHRLVQDAGGTMFTYNGRHWEEISDESLLALIFGQDRETTTRHSKRLEALAYLKAKSHKRGLAWGQLGEWEVPTANCVIDIATGKTRPHDADDWLESVLPWPYEPEASCPIWHRALTDWFGEDMAKWDALQEFFGYVCLSHARLKKALILYGRADTGKSQVALVLKALAGDRYCCTLPVEHMDDPRRCYVLVGKRLNVMTELTTDALMADGGFKTLVSTGEPILIDPKFKTPFMYTPSTKHAIATNNLPNINDRTEATFNRLLLIPFTHVIATADQDIELLDKLGVEMPGIVAWAIGGARRLHGNGGQFTEIGSAVSLMVEYRAECNPVLAFVHERMAEAAGSATPLSEITREFNSWYGGSRKFDIRRIGRALRGAGLTVGRARLSGHQARSLLGYVLKSDPSLIYPHDVWQIPNVGDEG